MTTLRQAAQQALEALGEIEWSNNSQWQADRAKVAIAALRAALAATREHVTDGSPCWCNPELNYVDPDTGAKVWVHKEPQ